MFVTKLNLYLIFRFYLEFNGEEREVLVSDCDEKDIVKLLLS